jgi:hypothetical protein
VLFMRIILIEGNSYIRREYFGACDDVPRSVAIPLRRVPEAGQTEARARLRGRRDTRLKGRRARAFVFARRCHFPGGAVEWGNSPAFVTTQCLGREENTTGRGRETEFRPVTRELADGGRRHRG